MPLVTRQAPSLFNGISQQPAPLRLVSQHEDLVNAYPTVVDGIRKRPGAQHVAKILDSAPASAFIHTIDRDETERYIVIVAGGEVRVFDLDGNEKTVNVAIEDDYLDTDNPAEDIAMCTVADYTFIVNKSKTVETTTPPTSIPEDYNDWHFPPSWKNSAGFDQTLYYNPANDPLTGTAQTFNDLPRDSDPLPPSDGDVWRIAGRTEGDFTSYYVKRQNGVWIETYAPGQSLGFDGETMPHALVRESDGSFTLTLFPWVVRKVGDNVTNPPPTFAGRQIKDVFFYKNRLGFVCEENVIFSCAGDYGNFWRTTVTDLLDSDVVDVAVSGRSIAKIIHAVAFEARLMLFAANGQFLLNVDQLLTPSTTSIDPVTSYQLQKGVSPIALGPNVYFVTPNGRHSRIREYFVQDDNNSTDAADITAHVPKLLPARVRHIFGNTNEDVLFAVDGTNQVWGYKFHFTDQGKVQSSWFRWLFHEGDKVIAGACIENDVYLLFQRDDGVYLERFDLEEGATSGDLDFEVLLDRQALVSGVYNSTDDETTFALPYEVPSDARGSFRLVKGADFDGAHGQLLDPEHYTWVSADVISIPGDVADGGVHAGYSYTMVWEMSEQFPEGRDGQAITTGRLQLRTVTVYYVDTAFFRVHVDPYGNGVQEIVEDIVPAKLSEFTGKTLGESTLVIGRPNFATGTYRFQPYCNSKAGKIRFINDTHVQAKFQTFEWQGLYSDRM